MPRVLLEVPCPTAAGGGGTACTPYDGLVPCRGRHARRTASERRTLGQDVRNLVGWVELSDSTCPVARTVHPSLSASVEIREPTDEFEVVHAEVLVEVGRMNDAVEAPPGDPVVGVGFARGDPVMPDLAPRPVQAAEDVHPHKGAHQLEGDLGKNGLFLTLCCLTCGSQSRRRGRVTASVATARTSEIWKARARRATLRALMVR